MDPNRVLNHVLTEINKLRDDQISHLATGGAQSFDGYRHVCGIIRGLTHAEQLVNDLVQRMDTTDD